MKKRKSGAGQRRVQGIAVLFSGPSGTGKIVEGEVLALDVLRIDLSRVVSKFIGETEKNLNRVFAEAERSGAILFFDEGDALFGKRTGVRDGHDRNANPQVALLLQRMETYPGIAVLSTKPRRAIDEAARRPGRFLVDLPIAKTRNGPGRIRFLAREQDASGGRTTAWRSR